MSAPRVDLITANKEGLVSLFGYLPLYLIAEFLSFNIFFHPDKETVRKFANADSSPPAPPPSSLTSRFVFHRPCSANHKVHSQESETTTSKSTVIAPSTNTHSYFNYSLMRRLAMSASTLWLGWLAGKKLPQPLAFFIETSIVIK
jgi:hypothetical protein